MQIGKLGWRLEATAMASRHNDQIHLSSCLSDGNHGRSKAQMCLKRILDFISSHSTHESGSGNGIDLNISLGGGSACSSVGADCGGKDENPQRESDEQEEEESSEITHVQEMEINPAPPERQAEDEEHSNKVKNGERNDIEEQSKGFLDLLVEAARLVSGDLQDDERVREPSRTGRLETQTQQCNEAVPPLGLKADANWFDCCGGIEVDMSPLVRSKRGRNQVLPSRYRDSVLEPLRRATTTSRPSAAKRKRF